LNEKVEEEINLFDVLNELIKKDILNFTINEILNAT